jgi:hypothetical protein
VPVLLQAGAGAWGPLSRSRQRSRARHECWCLRRGPSPPSLTSQLSLRTEFPSCDRGGERDKYIACGAHATMGRLDHVCRCGEPPAWPALRRDGSQRDGRHPRGQNFPSGNRYARGNDSSRPRDGPGWCSSIQRDCPRRHLHGRGSFARAMRPTGQARKHRGNSRPPRTASGVRGPGTGGRHWTTRTVRTQSNSM